MESNRVGRRIYYEKTNGVILGEIGQIAGFNADTMLEVSLEQDTIALPVLKLFTPDQFSYIQLEYDQYAYEYSRLMAYKVNVETLELEFILIPEVPKEEIITSIEEQIAKLEQDLLNARQS